MNPAEMIVYAAGTLTLGFGIFHLFFWRLFRWKRELRKISSVNRGIVQILNLKMSYVFFLVAMLCFTLPEDMFQTRLGRWLMMGMSIFWLLRMLEQFVFFKHNHYAVYLLTFLFLLNAILFAAPVWLVI